MDGSTLITVAVLLVIGAGLAAMLDAALGRVSVNRVEDLARDGVRGAPALLAITRNLSRHISLLVLLQLAFEVTAIVLFTFAAVSRWDVSWWAGVVTATAMTLVSFVLIGVGPRTIGRQHPYPIALAMASPLRALGRALGPLTSLLILIGNAVTPGKGYREGPFADEVELRDLVDLAERRGDVEHGERQMIHSVFDLGDTIVREVMVPRTEVVWIERDKSARQALALALRSGFSRIPVVGEGIDDIVGVVYLKDVARIGIDEMGSNTRVVALMRTPEFVPESKPIDELLSEMQARRIHMAIVIDEYGGTAGLVTIEDIVEEIVGEITDEYDNERPPVEALPDGSVRVTARFSVEDLARLFDVTLPDEDVETVGGLLAQALGKVPIPGAAATVAELHMVAEGAAGRRNRIDSVIVTRVKPALSPVSTQDN